MLDWATVETEIDAIISDGAFPREAASQIRHFMNSVRDEYPPPEEVGQGYWRKSARFCWTSRKTEIEVFENQVEFYRFHDGATDVRHFPFAENGAISPELFVELQKPGTWKGGV
jgi:hypothetical protein